MISIHSRYNPIALVLVLFVNILMGCLIVKTVLEMDFELFYERISVNWTLIWIPLLILFIELLILRLLMVTCRYIIANNQYILYINPVLPFIRKRVYWDEYDCFYHFVERSGSISRTIWLVKDNKVEDCISGFYYNNFSKIRLAVKTNVVNKGKLEIRGFKRFLCTLGARI